MSKNIYYFIIIIIVVVAGYFSATIFFNDQVKTRIVEPEVEPEIAVVPDEVEPLEDRQARVPILIYHHIRPVSENDSESAQTFIVSPENFEMQLKYLTDNNFNAISLQALTDYLNAGDSLPENPVIITFDDGTVSQYKNAFPLLKKYNLTATFFIFSNPISRSQNYVTWEQLQEMSKAGMEIGGHGWYHLYLDRISEAELAREIVISKQTLEEKLGREITTFAYPFGSYNDQVTTALKDAGYQAVRDIVNGSNHVGDDLYSLNAYFVTNSFSRFKRIISN